MKPIILVKLKMRFVYKFFLTICGLLIALTVSLGLKYALQYKDQIFASSVEVQGALSINYVDGKKFDVTGNKTIKFSVTNSSDGVSYYNIIFNQVRGNGKYKLLYNDTLINEGNLETIDEIVTDTISIDSKETKIYTIEITNNEDSSLKGVLNIRSQNGKIETFADTILKNTKPSENALTKVGVEVAVDDEGLIKSNDDIGVSYYFRGNVKNNYVSFANLLWRIVRINGDGTVRLVLDNPLETLSSYYTEENKELNFLESNISAYLENWLNDNLKNDITYIANTKYCSDTTHDDAYNYPAYTRIMVNNIPTLNCLGNQVNSNIGLLTVDEVLLAGANFKDVNHDFYLNNSKITDSYFTMTAAKGDDKSTNLFMINSNGSINSLTSGSEFGSVRPVINLIKNVEVTGTGTESEPYTIVTGN